MEKIDYKRGKFLILTNRPDEITYDAYLEVCEINDMEPQGEDSEDFRAWQYDQAADNYDSDFDAICDFKKYRVPVTLSGSLGLWDGRHQIVPMRFDSVAAAILACIPRNCGYYIDVEYNDGVITVSLSHHDGFCHFEIRALSESGIEKDFEKDDFTKDDFARLPYLYE